MIGSPGLFIGIFAVTLAVVFFVLFLFTLSRVDVAEDERDRFERRIKELEAALRSIRDTCQSELDGNVEDTALVAEE